MYPPDARNQSDETPVLNDLSAEKHSAELLCKFCDELKGDPQFDLEGATQDRQNVCIPEKADHSSAVCTCGKHINYEDDSKCNLLEVLRDPSCLHNQQIKDMTGEISQSAGSCSTITPPNRSMSNVNSELDLEKPAPHFCRVVEIPKKTSTCSNKDNEPITEALTGIKMAQEHNSNCAWQLSDLMQTEDRIGQYMHRLEAKELLSTSQLQKADEMWASMEEAYLKKLRESEEKQKIMLSQEMQIRQSLSKWQKEEKAQLKRLIEVQTDMYNIEEQVRMKQKQLEMLTNEYDCLSRRIDSAKKELEQLHPNNTKKMDTVQIAQNKITSESSSLEKEIEIEKRKREEHEQHGRGTVRGAQDNLTIACRALLQTQLDRENLNAEEKALDLEVSMINESISSYEDQCQLMIKPLREEIVAVEGDITRNNLKCVQCNACVSTSDIKKRCNDCPRCLKGTCQYKDKTCSSDDCGCVCPDVKERFVENILDNMYNILESDIKKNRSHLASDVLKCLKKSNSGHLDSSTRHKIHNYVTNAVSQDLDAMIWEAGVKTKCDINPEQLKQLKLCPNEIVVGPLQDKPVVKMMNAYDCQTEIILNMAQTCSCKKWGGGCNGPCDCPGGPEACVCWQRAPSSCSSTLVGLSRSGILKNASHSTPKAHSCEAGSGAVTTVPSRVSFSSARTVGTSKKSVCACSGSARGQCKCSRSKSKSSIASRSSNVRYTACVRDELIKDVTNVSSKSPSTHLPICPHDSASCTCLEEKELKLHRLSSRGSHTSGPSAARLLARPDVTVVPCPSKRKPSPPVCDPPQDMSGSSFFKRFSAASIRQASNREPGGWTSSSASGGGTSDAEADLACACGADAVCGEGGAGAGAEGEGAEGEGAEGEGAEGVRGAGGADTGTEDVGAGTEGTSAGGAGALSTVPGAGGADGSGADAGGAGGTDTGAEAGGAGVGAEGVGAEGAYGAGAGAGGASGAGTDAGGTGGAGMDAGGAGANAAGMDAGAEGAVGAGTDGGAGGGGPDSAGPNGASGGARGGGVDFVGGSLRGAVPGGAGGGARGTGAGAAGISARGAGAVRTDIQGQNSRAKPKTSKTADSASSNAPGVTGGKKSPGKTDSGIYSRNSSPTKSSLNRYSPEPAIIVCDPRKCTGPCSPSQRGSAVKDWSKADDAKLWRHQTNFIKPPMKNSSANTDNLADDPCFRSYKKKLLSSNRKVKQGKLVTCNCSPKPDILIKPIVTGVHRQKYKDAVMEPQLPAFLRRYQSPKRACF